MNNISRKRISIILIIYAVIFNFIGGSLAYLNWETSDEQNTEIVFTVERSFSCAADVGGDITPESISLAPSTCTNSKHAIQRVVKVNPTLYVNDINVEMDLWLDINSIGSGLSNSENFKYALTTSSDSCTTGVVSSGTFTGKNAGDKIDLFTKKIYSASMVDDTYYLYIWLDEEETSTSTMNQTFSLSINGTCTDNTKGEPYYVVYSETDSSLRFYNDEEEITEGSTYNNLVATNVYTAYQNEIYTYDSETTNTTSPWNEVRDNVTKIVIEDEISPISTANWFTFFTKASSVDVEKLDTSRVTDMYRMFDRVGYDSSVTSFEIIGLNDFDTSNVINMYGMLQVTGYYATTFNIGDLSGWDTSNVTDMNVMFYDSGYSATTWNIGDLSGWDTQNVTNMSKMFQGAGYKATNWSLNLSDWNVNKVTEYTDFNTGVESKVTAPVWVN